MPFSTKIARGVVAGFACVLAGVSVATGDPRPRYPSLVASGESTAPCASSMPGVGIPLDRHPGKRVGALGLFEFTPDFRDLRRYRHRLMRNKAPVGVSGDLPVTLTVPRGARHRVALTYAGSRGRRAEVEFQPCPHKRRTVWPGGLTLRDRRPVTLRVTVGDGPPQPLRLGR